MSRRTGRRWPADAKATVAVLAVLVLVEVALLPDRDHSTTATRPTPAIAGNLVGSTTAPPSPSPTTQVAASGGDVDRLMIAIPEEVPGYASELFAHWIDANFDGCDTRCEVLERQRRADLPGLPAGGWLSAYDGYTTSNEGELDIDHVVPLHEAWISGAASWDTATRAAFANDLDAPELVAVTAATNRSKNDRDPAHWQPPARAYWCTYASAWVAVKKKWSLTADGAEVDALRNMLRGCPS